MSLLLHAAVAAALCGLMLRTGITPWWAFLATSLWALHPLRVESVAWISERKDLLSGLFLLLSLHAFWSWWNTGRLLHFILYFWWMALGMLAKPMLITMPGMLAMFWLWPVLRRWPTRQELGRLVVVLVPTLFAALLLLAITQLAQGNPEERLDVSVGLRAQNVFVSYARYLVKTVFPFGLMTPYFYPKEGWPVVAVVGSVAVMMAGTAFAIRGVLRQQFLFATSWFWWVGTLIPVIGIVAIGVASIADRYMYIPAMLPMLASAFYVQQYLEQKQVKFVAVAVLVVFFGLTVRQTEHWQTTAKIFGHGVAVEPHNPTAWSLFAAGLAREGRFAEAADAAQHAVALQPEDAGMRFQAGELLLRSGRANDAIPHFVEALSWEPQSPTGHLWLAVASYGTGNVEAAEREMRFARAGRSDWVVQTELDVAGVLLQMGQRDVAIEVLARVTPARVIVKDLSEQAVQVLCAAGQNARAKEIAELDSSEVAAQALATCQQQPPSAAAAP